MLRDLMKPAQYSRGALSCHARHPSKASHHRSTGPASKKATKKRDISTSFRKGPVPRPLFNTTQQLPAHEEETIIGIPPPAPSILKAGSTFPAQQSFLSQAEASTGLSLGEPCRIGRASTEPVVALAATAPVLTAQDLGYSLDDSSISSSDSDDSADALWAADPLASFDRVLDGLLVAPIPQSFSAAKPPSSSPGPTTSADSLTLSSLLSVPLVSTAAGQQQSAGQQSVSTSSSSPAGNQSKAKSSRPYSQSLAAAAAAPAVTVIHCETEYERELEAAAALKQLIVVKVESSQHLMQGGFDSSMRQTNMPAQLNTFLANSDSSLGYGFSGSSSGASSSTADVLASMGVNLGMPASSSSMAGSSMGPSSSLFSSPNANSSGEPFSPVHAWYKQLAAQYAHSAAAAGQVSPVRFLSVQCDGARARAVARRLGVSAPLAVVLVDAAAGRKLQEVCGAKIEQQLPNGLLYFSNSDSHGLHPTEKLTQLYTEAEMDALKSTSQFAVVAFHVHAAPPCVRSYGRMHGVAQQYTAAGSASPAVSFGVMDVDVVPEGAAVSSKLGLQQLPMYVIYQDGQEVARLSSSPDRRRLGEVLAQHVAAVSAAGSMQ